MLTIRVPYHLDEPLPEATLPDLPGASTVAPDLPAGDLWARMGHTSIAFDTYGHPLGDHEGLGRGDGCGARRRRLEPFRDKSGA